MKINRSELSKIVSGKILQNEPMSKHTTFHIGGKCDFYVEVKTISELQKLVRYCRSKKVPYFVIGFGSNILVKDKGIRGVVIGLRGDLSSLSFNTSYSNLWTSSLLQMAQRDPAFAGTPYISKRYSREIQFRSAGWSSSERKGTKIVVVGGGCALQLFVKKCADNGLSGAESLVGIPGTVGGAVIMNAGTKDGCVANLIKSVTVMNEKGTVKKIEKKSLKFFYRGSNIPPKNIIISVEFLLKKSNKNNMIKNSNKLMQHRVKTQPVGFYNAGCIFRNPDGDCAAHFIDEAGLKGTSIGGAAVSKLHANFINNTGRATANDVLKLIAKIQKKVKEKFNKELELEIKIIG